MKISLINSFCIFFTILNEAILNSVGTAYDSETIIMGERTTEDDVKFLVSIQLKKTHLSNFGTGHICSGVAIDRRRVLTAAQCGDVNSRNKNKFRTPDEFLVILNLYDLYKPTNETVEFEVKNFIRHPHYEIGLIEYDIAVIYLMELIPGDFYSSIKFSFPTIEREEQLTCLTVGWGRHFDEGPISNIPIKIHVISMTWLSCYEIFPKRITGYNICMIPIIINKRGNTCPSDVGGPLICNNNELFGIFSWRKTCGYSMVFTNLIKHIDWLIKPYSSLARIKF